jgi:asparagine synthase (glutamine-hydrolysing)
LLCEELDVAFDKAVRSRLIADVPVGILLSGGVDSTLVAAYAARASTQQIRTFTVGYEVGEVNETEPARRVANVLGSEHREVILTQEDVAARVPALLARLDQPVADPALVALHCVCELAREHVTVAVGGEGADELFAGYPRYRWLALSSRLGASPVPASVLTAGARTMRCVLPEGRSRRLVEMLQPGTVVDRHIGWVTNGRGAVMRGLWGPALLATRPSFDAAADARLVIARSGEPTTLGQFMALDQERWLPDDVLAKADRASMLVSLEMRTPFLDRGLAELASSISVSRLAGRRDKHLLRTLLERALPQLGGSPRKTAFSVPLAQWLRGPLRNLVERQLSDGRAFSEGWLDLAAVRRLVADHDAGNRDCSRHLWGVVTFGAWLDELRTPSA